MSKYSDRRIYQPTSGKNGSQTSYFASAVNREPKDVTLIIFKL